jgi:hypothetical protein
MQVLGMGWGCFLTIITGGFFLLFLAPLCFFQQLVGGWRCQDCGRKKFAPSLILLGATMVPALLFLLFLILFIPALKAVSEKHEHAEWNAAPVIDGGNPPLVAAPPEAPADRIAAAPQVAAVPAPTPLPAPVAQAPPAIQEPQIDVTNLGRKIQIVRPGGAGNTVIASDRANFDLMIKVMAGHALGDFTQLRESGRILIVVNGTSAEIIGELPDRTRVRILDGVHAGEDGWVEPRYIVDPEREEAQRKQARIEARKREADAHEANIEAERIAHEERMKDAAYLAKRAETLMKLARNLEEAQKFEGAIGYYRQVIKDFPNTPQAKLAATRIKALGENP